MSSCSPLSKFRYAFGKPGEGPHFHVFGVAIVDVLLTLLGAWGLSKHFQLDFWVACTVLFTLAFVLHLLFGVPTKVMTTLGLVEDTSTATATATNQNPLRKKAE